MKPEIKIAGDRAELTRMTAALLLNLAKRAVQAEERCTIALSGGSTPKDVYALLADDVKLSAEFPWKDTYFFWGDERHVPPDHDESNYRMANQAMLSKVPIPAANVHRIKAENPDAAAAARDYERELRKFFQLPTGRVPRLDIALMGMGPEGHTASLFPGTKALREKKRLVVSNWIGKLYTDRITMTAPVLNRARHVVFIVAGDDKALALKAVLEGRHEPDQLPAQLIHPTKGRLLWLLDPSAARYLGKEIS
jgi:6-phosphogluconolactonase